MSELRTRNDAMLGALEPFLVAAPWHGDRFDRRPFGLAIPRSNVIDPTRVDSLAILDRLETLDRLTFGSRRMPMPRWLFYQASELPGAIFGFARRAERIEPEFVERLELAPGARGLVPLSMYIAMPAGPDGAWLGHNLASLNRLLPELELHGLGSITKAVALRVLRCRVQIGAVQWASPALNIHARFGPIEMLTAWTPAHTDPKTITYRVQITEARLRRGLGDPLVPEIESRATTEIAAEDVAAMKELQSRLEAGERFTIERPPRRAEDGTLRVPVSRQEIHRAV